jgi:hypothetical protein
MFNQGSITGGGGAQAATPGESGGNGDDRQLRSDDRGL